MEKKELKVHSKGRSHLYDVAILLKSLDYDIKFVSFWPSFKFRKLGNIKSFYIPYILVKLLVGEWLFFKLFRLFNRNKENVILDINLIDCYHPSSNLIIDMPTNFPNYQDEQWEIEEACTELRIERRKSTKERLLDNNLIDYIENSKLILVLNEASKNSIPIKYRTKVCVIPPLEITEIKKSVITQKKLIKNILCIGIICPSKGYHYMIQGLNRLNRKFNIHLYGKVNDSYVNYLKGISNEDIQLIFYGHVKQEKLLNLINQYDIMIFPSVSEGFPLSAIQVLSKGVPVFASRNSNLDGLLPDACIYDTRNINDFVKKFKEFEKKEKLTLNLENADLGSIKQKWKNIKKHL